MSPIEEMDSRFERYAIKVWYKNDKYEGEDLEMFDNEEIIQICNQLERFLQADRENILFDCEDIHQWYVFVDRSMIVPEGRQSIRIRPFPKGESLFEASDNGDCEIEIDLQKC